MKKLVAATLAAGIIALPGAAFASHGADDTSTAKNASTTSSAQQNANEVEHGVETEANDAAGVDDNGIDVQAENNATLPAGKTPEAVTLDEAVALIDARASRGGGRPTKRRSPRKAAAKAVPGEAKAPPRARKAKAVKAAE